MREIKFRAWNPGMGLMYKDIDLEGLSFLRTDKMSNSAMAFQMSWDFKYLVWMEYTGLKDKNGKEIYEGDIVDSFSGMGIGAIKYHCPSFGVDNWKGACTDYSWEDFEKFEVIGNIYENKELLV